jgi:hypothetical protein
MNIEQINAWVGRKDIQAVKLENRVKDLESAPVDDDTVGAINNLLTRVKTLEDNINYFIKQQRAWNRDNEASVHMLSEEATKKILKIADKPKSKISQIMDIFR